jgi:hypothetical protein
VTHEASAPEDLTASALKMWPPPADNPLREINRTPQAENGRDTVALISLGITKGALEKIAERMRSPMVNRQTIQRKMRHVQEFRTIPVLLKRLLEALENPWLSLEDIAAVVSSGARCTAVENGQLALLRVHAQGHLHKTGS